MLFALLPSMVSDMYSTDNLSRTNNLSSSSLLNHSNPQPTSMTSKCIKSAGLSKAWSTGTLSQIAKGNSLEFQSVTVLRALLVILDNNLLLTEEI